MRRFDNIATEWFRHWTTLTQDAAGEEMESRVWDGETGEAAVIAVVDFQQRLSLSATERRVLALSACGLRDAEIASELGRTEHQIKYAVRNAMTRLGAVTRTHAVALAISLGYISLANRGAEAS